MTNNDILKKLRVALQLRDEQIVEILNLVDFRISKGELGNFFRNEAHPKYVECQDQILRNFLNGLVIFLRGTKENPKIPKDVLAKVKETKIDISKQKSKTIEQHSNLKPKSSKNKTLKKPEKLTKNDIMGKVKFNNGKKKDKK